MTEAVSTTSGPGKARRGGGAAGGRKRGKGLTVERVWTTEGTHPYDEVAWERRDVVMTNWRDGSINFEQRGVEFPETWSINATNIVTSKYFRGAVGTPEREWSLRQLIDRVVSTYRKAGEEYGYFATERDATVFGEELTWLLLNQYFSFNSPVWFNVGTASPAQVSACFILAVDDSMDSILDWYKEEGLIFKGGSGSGVNLSRIRSSKELLSSGGNASGPVSFMRGADASAGTIKSGGATRRAAKMVVLDVDHPDIADFIQTKAREEDKIRALRDAGFDMDLGGSDIVSVQYQNANNSVRVSDEFMTAVEKGTDFALRGRLDGAEIERVDARDLFEKMAKAAWECADPGIQYDGTINDWHTNPETGRITASNPCFPADQRVVTDKGLIAIGDLVGRAADGETFAVYTNDVTAEDDPRHHVVATNPLQYMVTGTNPIIKLEFSDGSQLRCTPRHRLWTANRGWVHAEELTADDRVVRSDRYAPRAMASWTLPRAATDAAAEIGKRPGLRSPNLGEKWTPELAHYLGWLTGDGRLTDDTTVTVYGDTAEHEHVLPRHRRVLAELTGRESKPSEQPNGTVQLRSGVSALRTFLAGLGVGTGRAAGKTVPDPIFEAPEEIVAEYLQGLYDADGRAVELADGTRYVGLASRSPGLLRGVQELLGSFGVTSRIHQTENTEDPSFTHTREDGTEAAYGATGPCYDLRIGGRGIREFAALVGFGLPAKRDALTAMLDGKTVYPVDETITLVEKSDDGFETTYNLTEPRNHSYIVGGVVVANCSEYLSLDNSSCNLASLNLMKFLRDDDTFDVAKFVKAVEFVITAMEISISFADFPTDKIGEVTRAYRQLGIGYANLGALLMATGMAYDSDEGRAYAASITALMNAVSYRRSAEIAGVVGPYDGYARNADAHTRVMRKHAAAVTQISTYNVSDKALADEASAEWEKSLEIGAKNGWRNGQSSLLAPTGTIGFMMDCDTTGIEPDLALVKFKKLVGGGSMQIVNNTVSRALRNLGYQEEQIEAIIEYVSEHGHVVDAPGLRAEHYPVFDCAMGERSISPMGHVRMMAAVQPHLSGAISKCVVGDTLVPSENGLIRIGGLRRGEAEDTFREDRMVVASLGGEQKTDAFYYGGVRPTRKVTLRSGHSVRGTFPHRLLTAGPEGLDWKSLGELREGDQVAVQYRAELWSTVPADLRGNHGADPDPRCRKVVLPTEMTEQLAFLLGAYASEGHTTESNGTITITNSVPEVLELVRDAWHTEFGVKARIDHQPGRCSGVVVSSKTIVGFMRALGCGSRASDKRIPDAVLTSPRHMVVAFLRGLALDAYVTTRTAPKWGICLDSPQLLDDLQSVLTNMGIVHGRISKYNKEYDKYFDEVYAAGRYGQTLVSEVPFLEPDKARTAEEFLDLSIGQGTSSIVPGLAGPDLYALIPRGRSGRAGSGTGRQEFNFLQDKRTKHVSRETLMRVAELPGVELPDWLRQILDDRLHFSPVVSVTDEADAEVYDLSVPGTHAFVANGIMNHNTVNVPESATVDDFKQIYFEGWKLGLKALAVYRDNCKVGQPLSVKQKEKAAEEPKAEVEKVVEYRPVRKRLPKKRPSQTVSFSVGGAEGYMTASSYPDNGLGEVFFKMSKQGSTLAGIMDAFSVAISIALQYGVPLEKYVEKFTNMRFEPAGMTDDPDIRMATSVVDYLFRRMALDFLPYETRSELGILTSAERVAEANGEDPSRVHDDEEDVDLTALASSAPIEKVVETLVGDAGTRRAGSSMEVLESALGKAADAPLCMTCGTKMRPAGSCYVCEGCGSTSGCS